MPQTPQKPFDLPARQLKGFTGYAELGQWLCEEIQHARGSRGISSDDLDYWHRIYEQARTRLNTNQPQAAGADLTSPLGTQYVDSLHARAMQTVFGADRIWVVEGWGSSMDKAPYVEEFHQWTAEDERVQSYLDQCWLNAFVDGVGILEVFEETDYQPVRRTIWAKVETQIDPLTQQARMVFDERRKPKFLQDAEGKYLEVPEPKDGEPLPEAVAQIAIDDYQLVRRGPGYEVIDYQDFLVLPSAARSPREVWGYAKRFYRRWRYLQQKAKDGLYDQQGLTAIGPDDERQASQDEERREVGVTALDDRTSQKELYEIAFKYDLDGKGERWWVATVHEPSQTLLRLKYDELGTQIGFGRFCRFVPLPRKNSVDGFSLIGHKLITTIEEHTAIRNMRADRSALRTNVPIKVSQNALYNPDEQPFGVGATIYVRDMNEIQPFDVPDVPVSLNQWESTVLSGAERTIGLTDISTGVQPEERRTATERSITAAQSEVRSALIIRRLQETMEELGQIRHVIWKRTLASQPDGMEMPAQAVIGLGARGIGVDSLPGGRVTADLLEGKFRFKPRGSTETANPAAQVQAFVQMLNALRAVMQVNPMVQQMWATPQAARALNERVVTLFHFPDRQAVLNAGARLGPGQMPGGPPGLPMPPAQGGPPGMPPMPPGPQPPPAGGQVVPFPMPGGLSGGV